MTSMTGFAFEAAVADGPARPVTNATVTSRPAIVRRIVVFMITSMSRWIVQ